MGSSFRPTGKQRLAAALGLIAAVALGAGAAMRGAPWANATTPGFFVDPALNVSLLSLPGWPKTAGYWPSTITRANGAAVDAADQVYAAARGGDAASAPDAIDATDSNGTVTYATARLGIPGPDLVVRPHRLSLIELCVLFLGLVVNGTITIAVALIVWRNQPTNSTTTALLVSGTALGVFAVTTVTVLGDGSLARLNILAQCLAAAGILHLALVFPADVLPRARGAAMFAIYAPFAALALVYQLIWPDPYGTGLLHGVATVAIAVASLLLSIGIFLRLWSRRAIVVRRRAAIAMSGVVGVGAVAASWISVAGFEWRAAAAAIVSCGALIPLAIGAAIAARDFFALDQRLRSILTYALAIPAIALLYGTALLLFGSHRTSGPMTLPFLAINVAVIVLIAPIIRVARRCVDRAFSPESYSVDRSLDHLKRGLTSARSTQTLVGNTVDILRRTLQPSGVTVYLRDRGAGFPVYAYDDPAQRRIAVPAELTDAMEADETAFRQQLNDGPCTLPPESFDRFRADVLVPISRAGSCVGMIALAGRRSGRPYDGRDIAFVQAAAGQIALALPNAAAQERVDVLHETLEELSESLHLQASRIQALKDTNLELAGELARLRETQRDFGDRQRSLAQAERLETLERLSLALTQELTGPLATVLVALRDIARLGREQTGSPQSRERQRYAIEQMVGHAATGAAWLERIIAYLRDFQTPEDAEDEVGEGDRFGLRDAFNEAAHLLGPRLRAASCRLEYTESAANLELQGSRQRFVLILVDLIGAAIEACQEAEIGDPRVVVDAEHNPHEVRVSVVDWANGLPTAAIPQLLDQLAAAERIGNRRGLWIARNLIEEGFGGTLDVTTNDEMTRFTAVLPHRLGRRGPLAATPSLRLAAND